MKRISFIALVLVIIFTSSKQSLCQNNENLNKSDSLSKVFLPVTFGITEIMSFVAGYHIDKNNSIGIKWSGAWISKDFLSGGSEIGIKYSHLFNYHFFLKQVNLFISAIYDGAIDKSSFPANTFVKGFAFGCTVGNKINHSKGFSFIYDIGFFTTQLKGKNMLFWPSLMMGINFNF